MNLDGFHYHSFVTSMKRREGTCYSIEDPYDRISVLNEIKDVNSKAFNVIKRITESNILVKQIS